MPQSLRQTFGSATGVARRSWQYLFDSFWALPLGIVLLAIMVAYALVGIDRIGFYSTQWLRAWLWTDGVDEARAVATGIAGGAISIAGIAFSTTMVVLTLAANQLGPRLLRNFVRDRRVQFTLGTLLATFLYSLLMLRAVGDGGDSDFVPHLAVSMNMGLALVAVTVFILFIAHIVTSIQSPQVIGRVGVELDQAITRTYPDSGETQNASPPDADAADAVLSCRSGGYLQQIDHESMVELCAANNLRAELLHRVGEYVLQGSPMLRLWRGDGSLQDDFALGDDEDWPGESLASSLLNAVIISAQRTPVQDITFAMNQLAEIAIRALSPGINDPFTAMNALNRLADGLNHIGRRGVQKVTFYCDDEPRLYIAGLSKAATVDTAFDTVREFAVGSHLVTRHVLSLIDRLLPRLDNEEMRQRLGEKATLYADIYLASSPAESDKAPIQRLVDSIADQLKSVGASNDEESSDYGTSGD